MSEAMIQLIATKDTVDPNKIGLISGAYPHVTPVDARAIMDGLIRFGVAQAKIDNIQSTYGGMVARPIWPHKDLLDGSGTAITSADWRQPVASNYTTATGAQSTAVTVYTTATLSRNDRKVLIVGGFKNVGTGPFRQGTILASNMIIAKRTDVRLIDILHLQDIETNPNNELWLMTPWLFRRNDEANFLHVPNARVAVSADKYEELKYIGIVVESLGSNMAG
jgi:hypothetical protein